MSTRSGQTSDLQRKSSGPNPEDRGSHTTRGLTVLGTHTNRGHAVASRDLEKCGWVLHAMTSPKIRLESVVQRWFSFEEEVKLLVQEFGYRAECTPKTGDHGVDIIAKKNGRIVAVQVKLHGTTRVGNRTVIMLLGGMRVYGATEALLITSGKLTKKAQEACLAATVAWYDGSRLRELCIQRGLTLPSWCEIASATGKSLNSSTRQVIGRDPGCTLCIPTDRLLSRRHFELRRTGLKLEVVDLSSTNGTFINGIRISGSKSIGYGDTIRAGSQRWVVGTSGESVAAVKKSILGNG